MQDNATQRVQDALFPDLAGLAERGPVGRPTSPANGARHETHGQDDQPTPAAPHDGPAARVGLADVPLSLREFATVDRGQLAAHNWRFWDPGTAPAQAALEYRQRLGAWPAAVIRNPTGGQSLAGPVSAEVRP